jgi:hypothetical protein
MLEKQRDSSNKICELQRKGDNAMAAMLSITGLGVAQNSAQANTKDRSWSFNLTIGSEYKFISKEKKKITAKFILTGMEHIII